ncbi:DUF7130 family rubredoxin-like protein [Haloarchaeobius sp. TZWWS8]|uniref:DUF7130 family rubredoxin-like protein n=1 Tax=Haloarchaeobius sp. TZWWS8 TaxID=3446121 RepID=UPI003EB8D4A6
MADDTPDDTTAVDVGQTVCTPDGTELGEIRRFTSDGFEVALHDSVEQADGETNPGQEFGEGYIMWRCEECGEMGELDDEMPEQCPSCGAAKEHLFRAVED